MFSFYAGCILREAWLWHGVSSSDNGNLNDGFWWLITLYAKYEHHFREFFLFIFIFAKSRLKFFQLQKCVFPKS